MNQLVLTFPGKMPLVQDDLKFIQDAYLEAFKGVLSAFNIGINDSYILSGFEHVNLGGNNNQFSAGYICLNGEVYYFAGATLNVALSNIRVGITEVAVAPSPKTFKDLTTKNVNIQRRAAVGVFSGQPLYTSLKRIEDVIGEKVAMPSQNLIVANTYFSATGLYGKDRTGVVRLQGFVTKTNVLGTGAAFTLPVGFRPTINKHFVLAQSATNAPDVIAGVSPCLIDTNGNFFMPSSTPINASIRIDLSFAI